MIDEIKSFLGPNHESQITDHTAFLAGVVEETGKALVLLGILTQALGEVDAAKPVLTVA